MNQRDQNRYGQQRPEEGSRNQRQGRYGAMPPSGAGQQPSPSRFTDTYNPEPQWLHDEEGSARRSGQPLGGGDYDRSDEDYRRGRYATTGQERGYGQRQGRPYGAPRQGAGAMEYEQEYGRRDYGPERGYGQRMGGRWDEDHPGPGQYQGAYASEEGGRFGGEGRFGYGPTGYEASRQASGYGASTYRGQEYGRPGGRPGLQFASDYGGGGYDQVSGTYGYSGRGSQATGDAQFRMQGSGMEGQRSYRGLGPQTYKRSDDRIRDDVCERLTDDARIDASNITIDVNQGAVTLSGVVPERYMRYAAEDLVDDAMGVESINNQLRVQSRAEPGSMASGSRASTPSELEKQKH